MKTADGPGAGEVGGPEALATWTQRFHWNGGMGAQLKRAKGVRQGKGEMASVDNTGEVLQGLREQRVELELRGDVEFEEVHLRRWVREWPVC